jgi:PadR family transcriptional regulator PadR
MKPPVRLSPQTLQVLDAFLSAPKDWKYGYDISRNTGLKSGTLYPILMRLAERKLLDTSWETAEIGKPPRHLYRLTPDGLRFARQHKPSRSTVREARAAFSEAKG